MHDRGPSNIIAAPLFSWQGFITSSSINYGEMESFCFIHCFDFGYPPGTELEMVLKFVKIRDDWRGD